ncbi:hypothetical protein ACXIT0_07050 [Methylorubrum extorquens]
MSQKTPPSFPHGLPCNALRLRDLPGGIRKKIDKGRGREDAACWCWTGYIKPARQRWKAYRTHEDFDGLRHQMGCFEVDRATPEFPDPHTRKRAPVHRIIYGLVTGVSIEDVPELRRCADDRCVNPHHVLAVGYTAAQRGRMKEQEAVPFIVQPAAEPDPVAMTDEEVLALLKKHRPFEELEDFALIEDECEIPRGRLTLDLWKAYLAWAVDNPDEWDEEERRDAVG